MKIQIKLNYFTAEELGCKCCGVFNLHPVTLMKLELLRVKLGYPLRVNSACRCPEHNKNVGGSSSSSHIATMDVFSHAVDLGCKNDCVRSEIVNEAIKLGFNRIGVYKTFVHIDDDLQKTSAIWYG